MNIDFFSQGDLILLCVFRVIKVKEECTFERLVYECFTAFPEKFSFYTYNLPDSLKLDRQIRTLRQQGYIKGSNRSSFKLTSTGSKRALQISSQLPQKNATKIKTKKTIKLKRGRKEKLLISKVRSSTLFKKFDNKTKLKPTVDELRLLFFGTLETSVENLIENAEYCKEIAEKAGDKDVVKFINFCKQYLKNR